MFEHEKYFMINTLKNNEDINSHQSLILYE